MNALTIEEAYTRLQRQVADFEDAGPEDSVAGLEPNGVACELQRVAEILRAADDFLTALNSYPRPTSSRLDELHVLTRALRRMAFLVLAQHDPDQAWFWTPEWQAGERQADADKAAGRYTRYFSDEEFLSALRDSRHGIADI